MWGRTGIFMCFFHSWPWYRSLYTYFFLMSYWLFYHFFPCRSCAFSFISSYFRHLELLVPILNGILICGVFLYCLIINATYFQRHFLVGYCCYSSLLTFLDYVNFHFIFSFQLLCLLFLFLVTYSLARTVHSLLNEGWK